ncbi:hypothetical protein JCGZ_00148 [Jatropha curcas]|uniref:Uncharacterized protein n=1 Tax=Jatropha curcas TaxID=180498 RepID=A0A067JW73_JATCU|nr:hypothetical protein JCGZ_00148 [Jatropha curcas]
MTFLLIQLLPRVLPEPSLGLGLDQHMVRPLPNPTSIQTSPEYRTWFITTVWPIERPRRTALLSVLEGWVQTDEIGTGEDIVLAPRTGEAGQSSIARGARRMLLHGGDGTPRLL